MQPHQDDAQRYPPYESPLRVPSSPASSNFTGQSEAPKASQTQTPSRSSHLAKLDGVLYHFYTTTANLVLQSRLARYRSKFLPISTDDEGQQLPTSLADPSSASKNSRWFAMQIPENDLFKEELRFWRSITAMLDSAGAADNGTIGAAPGAVPDMVIDVILDLSNVATHHQTLFVPRTHSTASAPLFAAMYASPSKIPLDRVPIDSEGSKDKTGNCHDTKPNFIVLEQWKLHFESSVPDVAPELPTLYKRSIVHFRSLFTLLLALPANRLSARLESLYNQAIHSVSSPVFSPQGHPSLSARIDLGSHDHEMKIGCRLSMSNDGDNTERVEGEYRIQDPLLAEEDAFQNTGHTVEKVMTPIVTPVGNIAMSVKYRKLADYSVEDANSFSRVRNMEVEVDEDYFKPTSKSPSSLPFPALKHQFPASGLSDGPGKCQAEQDEAPVPAYQQIGGITAGRLSHLGGPSNDTTLDATTEPASAQLSAPVTVFSTGATGRPVAGLSSLRNAGSLRDNPVGSTGISIPPSTPHSPALAAALNTEPAFVAAGAIRRTSTSDRRLRSSGGSTGGVASPAISPSAANFDLPETSSSLPKNIYSTHSASAPSVKPKYGRLASGGSLWTGATQSRPGISFSPSSSSPLVPQTSLQGSRVPSGHVFPLTSRSISSSHLSTSPSMRLSAADSSMATPSLRSVFQNYAPRSSLSTSSSLSRTALTATTAAQSATHGSYSPSGLGMGQRASSIRRYSNSSDAGSGSAFGAGSSAAAQPQMIKRYSSNFSYRQNRDRQGTYGSSLGSEGSGSGGPGAESSSYPHNAGQGGSLSSGYGRSWVARMEQRQGLVGTHSGPLGRNSSQEDQNVAPASTSLRFRSSPAAAYTPTGGLTPSPRSQDDEIGAFIRLLDSKPAFGGSFVGKQSGSRRSASALGSTPEESGRGVPPAAYDESTRSDFKGAGEPRRSSPASSQPLIGNPRSSTGGLRSSVYSPIRTAHPLSRSQVDEMLSRMAESVGMIPATDATASNTSQSPSCFDPDGRSNQGAKVTSSDKSKSRPAIKGIFSEPASHTAIQEHCSSTEPLKAVTSNIADHVRLPGYFAASERSRFAGIGQTRGMQTASIQYQDESNTHASRFNSPGLDLASTARHITGHPMDPAPDYEIEGDLMFGSDQPHYDIEDDLPGKMDMAAEEGSVHGLHQTSRRSSTSAEVAGGTRTSRRSGYGDAGIHNHVSVSERESGGGGDSIEGVRGATLPAGAHRNGGHLQHIGPMPEWLGSEQRERERALEAERRRADAEMSRNFGQEVGASTRGRGSLSPWRASGHGMANTQTGNFSASLSTASPTMMTSAGHPITGQSVAGFRSSSTRPLTGADRLSSQNSGAGRGEAFSRRGYGVSAPSTQFHHNSAQLHSKQSSNSYPASRDEMPSPNADDEEDDEEEEDSIQK